MQSCNSSGICHSTIVDEESYAFGGRCIAPSLEDYLAPGGHNRFYPQPQWLAQNVDGECWRRHIASLKTEQSLSIVADATYHQRKLVRESSTKIYNCDLGWEREHLSDQESFWRIGLPLTTEHKPAQTSRLFPHFETYLTEENTTASFVQHMLLGDMCSNIAGITFGSTKNINHASSLDEINRSNSCCAVPLKEVSLEREESSIGNEIIVFGKDCNTALHVAIREGATEAALSLIKMGADPNIPNAKGVTPIILSSQLGILEVTQALVHQGANLSVSSHSGITPLIQASHFGYKAIVEFLLSHGARQNQANLKNTTALMRGSQEGHKDVVQTLLRYGADPNLANRDDLTALMLAAQRGHVDIIKLLLRSGAKLDVCTSQNSTALMLACKRGNLNVARILVGRGCDLEVRDNRGRKAKDIVMKLECEKLAALISLDTQVFLMKQDVAVERNFELVKLWILLHSGRSSYPVNIGVHGGGLQLDVNNMSAGDDIHCDAHSQIILRMMLLPLSLVGHIAGYMSLPMLFEKRLEMMTRRCLLNPDSTISCALDLIDDVLEEIGFVEACDAALITAPEGFSCWSEWKKCRRYGMKPDQCKKKNSMKTCGDRIAREQLSLKMKREVCFLQILAHHTTLLSTKLSKAPYYVPEAILKQLRSNSDIASLTRRVGTNLVRFDASVASDIVNLAGALVLWHRGTR